MAFHGVTVLKFVGTVSLGLLTGLSFSLATVTVPTLVALPSARAASDAFRTLAAAAAAHLNTLAGVASSSFLLAFVLSPRPLRHPYLLYTGLLVLGGRALTSARVWGGDGDGGDGGDALENNATASSSPASPPLSPLRAPAHMEASYEVLGEEHSDEEASTTPAAVAKKTGTPTSSNSGSGSDGASAAGAAAGINGEEVRASVEVFLKKQMVRTAVSGAAFAMAIVGLWGDGAAAAAVAVPGQYY